MDTTANIVDVERAPVEARCTSGRGAEPYSSRAECTEQSGKKLKSLSVNGAAREREKRTSRENREASGVRDEETKKRGNEEEGKVASEYPVFRRRRKGRQNLEKGRTKAGTEFKKKERETPVQWGYTRGQNEKKKDEHTKRGTSEKGDCRTKYVCTAEEQVW